MNKNHEKVEQIILEYLKKNRKTIILDSNAKEILKVDSDSFEYFEYEISEINIEIRKAGLSLDNLPPSILNLTKSQRYANYLSKINMIAIKKGIPKEYIMCEFIHEFIHRKFSLREWDKTNFKKILPDMIDFGPEENTCKILSYEYAKKKGFEKEYAKNIGLFDSSCS